MDAAPIIRKSRGFIGAPAKTDFVNIFICEDVSPREFEVLKKHEQSHIWLAHNSRMTNSMNAEAWKIATEIEIARNIYNQNDIDVIKAPLSRISGGFTPDTIPDLPKELLLAEEIHDWLLKNKKKADCACCNTKIENSDTCERVDKMDVKQVRSLVEEAKESAKREDLSYLAEKNTKSNLEEIINRRPSLVEAIDAALRVRVVREESYRRPRRGSYDKDIIMKGRISSPRPPLVEIFVDRSGSFTPEKTRHAEESLSRILTKYGASIKNDVWFFGSGKISSSDFYGGDTPYHLISEHLNLTRPHVAVVITDNDPCDSGPIEKKIVPNVLVIPIGCNETDFARKTGATEVSR